MRLYQNEKQNNIDSRPFLKKIKTAGVPIYSIYGKDDGIFSLAQINSLKAITGEKNFAFLNNCSHYLFVDQQAAFLSHISKWLN